MFFRSVFRRKKYLFFILFLSTLGVLIFTSLNRGKIEDNIDITNIFGPSLPANYYQAEKPINNARIALGRELYYDRRLSRDGEISCNSCHQLDKYGVDNAVVSKGDRGQLTRRNSPSVYHAPANVGQCWDGRFLYIEDKAKESILDPVEMAMPSEEKIVEVLSSIPKYTTDFQRAFPEDSNPITLNNVAIAMDTFIQGLTTPSPFDRYFAGEQDALSDRQKKGMKLFIDVGCATCHNGTYLGGHIYRKIGLLVPWPNQQDLGRYEITKEKSDLMVFKVPTLRNVTKTAPYYHDGLVKTLEDAIRHMAINQLGKQLSLEQISDIVVFLESLEGELPKDYIKRPLL